MLFRFADGLRVFASYCWRDQQVVRSAVGRLQQEGLCVFLDTQVLDQQLVEELERIRSRQEEDRQAKLLAAMRDPSLSEMDIADMILQKDQQNAGPFALEHLGLALQDAIEESGLVMYWHSTASAKSIWVRRELELADRYGAAVLVMRLDDLPLPRQLRDRPEFRWHRPTTADNLAMSVTGGRGAKRPAQDAANAADLARKVWRGAEDAAMQAARPADLDRNREAILAVLQERKSAPGNGQLVFLNARLNRLLAERWELHQHLQDDWDPADADETFPVDTSKITCRQSHVGKLIVDRDIAGPRAEAWPRYCGRCAGLINFHHVYPELDDWITRNRRFSLLNAAGCSCG